MIIVDTHTLVWAVQDDAKLGTGARGLLHDHVDDAIVVPAICAWEIALLHRRGKADLSGEPDPWFRRVLARPGYMLAPLEPAIAIASVNLGWSHKDPADRMIVATAQHWAAPLLTADREILAYAAAGHLHAVDATL